LSFRFLDSPIHPPLGLLDPFNGNGNATPSSAVSGKHKSKCWADFNEIYEEINGNKVRVQAICKLCRTTLSARSIAGTGHILSHDLFLILMVLCIIGTMIMLLLELNYVD
jgi:hypothetical protein